MWEPKFTITPGLLANIKRVYQLVTELNQRRFPNTVLVELERVAREVSAYASTSIEGNPLPLTEVKRLLKSHPRFLRDTEREVINYNRALGEMAKWGEGELNTGIVLKVHGLVMEGLLSEYRVGKFRQEPVFVNDPVKRQALYLPPDASDVERLVGGLIEYVHENQEVDPLILAGVFHKQLVIIHPFMDGNGRTTRLLTKLILAKMGVDTFNLFSFENYYNQNVTKYFGCVGEKGNYYEIVERVDFTAWLEYFTGGIVDELLRVTKELDLAEVSPEKELQPYHQTILDFIAENGYIRDRDYAKLTDRAKATRALDFKKLIKMGMIEMVGRGKGIYYRVKTLPL